MTGLPRPTRQTTGGHRSDLPRTGRRQKGWRPGWPAAGRPPQKRNPPDSDWTSRPPKGIGTIRLAVRSADARQNTQTTTRPTTERRLNTPDGPAFRDAPIHRPGRGLYPTTPAVSAPVGSALRRSCPSHMPRGIWRGPRYIDCSETSTSTARPGIIASRSSTLLAAVYIFSGMGIHSLTTGSRHVSRPGGLAHVEHHSADNLGTVVEQEHKQPVRQTQGKPASGPYVALSLLESMAVWCTPHRHTHTMAGARHVGYGLEHLWTLRFSRMLAWRHMGWWI